VTFGMPVRGLAVAMARLADPSSVPDRPLADALRRIRDAMMAHPELVGGDRRRLDTDLMRAFPRRLVSKGGAEGVLAMGLLPGALDEGAAHGDGPVGIAIKIEDGSAARAGGVAAIETLRQLGLLSDDAPASLAVYASPPVVDPRGEPSGEIRPAFTLA
jgi:L-asparaginase II